MIKYEYDGVNWYSMRVKGAKWNLPKKLVTLNCAGDSAAWSGIGIHQTFLG